MGIYLSNPKTEKFAEKGQDSQVQWVSMGMQGLNNNKRMEN